MTAMGSEITNKLDAFASSSLLRWFVWLGFAILFYKSGETFTVWLLEPEQISGGFQWVWILLFPVLVPAFFIVNRKFGCASGACATRSERGAAARFPGH